MITFDVDPEVLTRYIFYGSLVSIESLDEWLNAKDVHENDNK